MLLGMDFHTRKVAALRALASPLPDKSRKGGVDAPVAGLIELINQHPAFFTTSSCSGRISVSTAQYGNPHNLEDAENCEENMKHKREFGDNSDFFEKQKKKKMKGGEWSYVSHSQVDAEEVIQSIICTCSRAKEEQINGVMMFRFEPFILAVECLDLGAAQTLVSCAISSGFRESGITSVRRRVIAAVRCSIRIETPIAEKGHLLVSENYLRFLVRIANEKMVTNHERTSKFFMAFEEQVHTQVHERDPVNRAKLVRGQSYSCVEKNGTSHRRKGRAISSDRGRKVLELEKRQLHLLSRLDELESWMCSSVLKSNGAGLESSALDQEAKENDVAARDVHYTDALPWLDVPMEGVSKSISAESVAASFSPLLVKGSLEAASEKLYRWGHSTCLVPHVPTTSFLIFGGYGGSSKQGRQNDLLLVTLEDGKVESIYATDPPAPRMGHTASFVGGVMVVIGGREDPSKSLRDVCVFSLERRQWIYPKMGGAYFPPRHRHGAAAIEEKIYIFGGLDNANVLGDLLVLDTSLMQWSVAESKGNRPSPRYSHSMSVINAKLFLFGGFDGRMVFGDLWALDTLTLHWSRVNISSIPRFSHTLTPCAGSLVLLGGCPLTKLANVILLLHIDTMNWVHAKVELPPQSLFVRHSATCIGDKIVVIGGGLSCYAFGIKFSPPFLLDLTPLSCLDSKRASRAVAIEHLEVRTLTTSNVRGLMIDKVHAKLAKDNLKGMGWLDLERKAKASGDGLYIIFPISAKAACELEATNLRRVREWFQCSCLVCVSDCKVEYKLVDLASDVPLKSCRGPHQLLQMAMSSLLQKRGLPLSLLREIPKKWEKFDDMAVLPANAFTSEIWSSLGQLLWETITKCLNVNRIARQARVKPNSTRDSGLVLLFGEDGWVHHRENGILYGFDATKCMFSSGNVSEKLRMAKLDCNGETVVDLFAGIGYFVLPFLLKANAKRVYACEWNPPALEALRNNLRMNGMHEQCTVLEGDNRLTAPQGIADRVCLGLLPTSEHCWGVAVKALCPGGGMLHVHGNVKDAEEQRWAEHVCNSIGALAEKEGHCWDVYAAHVERVKWYAPHIRHVVVDVKCSLK